MNIKTILAVIGLLAIGYVLGILTAGMLVRGKVNHAHKLMEGNHFEEMLIKNVDPTQEQLEVIRPIIKDFEKEFKQTRKSQREIFRTMIDTMRQDVRNELTEQQQVLFDEHLEEMRKMMVKRRKMDKNRKHPPLKKMEE